MGLLTFVKILLIFGTFGLHLTLGINGEKDFTNCSAEIASSLIVPTLQNISLEIQELRRFQKSVERIFHILISEQTHEFIRNFESVINNNERKTTALEASSSSTSRREETEIDGDCTAGEDLDTYVTSPRYVNTRIITSLSGVFDVRNISKETSSSNCARMKCSEFCDQANNCHAFNFYETATSYACELVPDNLCLNKTRLAFVNWPGGNVWEKRSAGMSQSCVDTRFGDGEKIACEVLRPGCLGTWPKCFDCVQQCDACIERYFYFSLNLGIKECTIWPESNKPYSVPIHLRCSVQSTHLVSRTVNVTTAEMTTDFQLSFKDMNRLSNLKTRHLIDFAFVTTADEHYYYTYDKWTIDSDGTLRDMVLYDKSTTDAEDIFNLNGTALKPTPFVTVEDDRFGCGSFWLLDPKNATYCPGGKVSMFGKLKFDNKKLVSTGMSCPQSLSTGHTIRLVSIKLIKV